MVSGMRHHCSRPLCVRCIADVWMAQAPSTPPLLATPTRLPPAAAAPAPHNHPADAGAAHGLGLVPGGQRRLWHRVQRRPRQAGLQDAPRAARDAAARAGGGPRARHGERARAGGLLSSLAIAPAPPPRSGRLISPSPQKHTGTPAAIEVLQQTRVALATNTDGPPLHPQALTADGGRLWVSTSSPAVSAYDLPAWPSEQPEGMPFAARCARGARSSAQGLGAGPRVCLEGRRAGQGCGMGLVILRARRPRPGAAARRERGA